MFAGSVGLEEHRNNKITPATRLRKSEWTNGALHLLLVQNQHNLVLLPETRAQKPHNTRRIAAITPVLVRMLVENLVSPLKTPGHLAEPHFWLLGPPLKRLE